MHDQDTREYPIDLAMTTAAMAAFFAGAVGLCFLSVYNLETFYTDLLRSWDLETKGAWTMALTIPIIGASIRLAKLSKLWALLLFFSLGALPALGRYRTTVDENRRLHTAAVEKARLDYEAEQEAFMARWASLWEADPTGRACLGFAKNMNSDHILKRNEALENWNNFNCTRQKEAVRAEAGLTPVKREPQEIRGVAFFLQVAGIAGGEFIFTEFMALLGTAWAILLVGYWEDKKEVYQLRLSLEHAHKEQEHLVFETNRAQNAANLGIEALQEQIEVLKAELDQAQMAPQVAEYTVEEAEDEPSAAEEDEASDHGEGSIIEEDDPASVDETSKVSEEDEAPVLRLVEDADKPQGVFSPLSSAHVNLKGVDLDWLYKHHPNLRVDLDIEQGTWHGYELGAPKPRKMSSGRIMFPTVKRTALHPAVSKEGGTIFIESPVAKAALRRRKDIPTLPEPRRRRDSKSQK